MKTYFFLSGIARSGSTLLGSILNQNPDFYVSPTSPLLDLYCMVEESIQKLNKQYTYDQETVGPNIHKGLHHLFYKNIKQPYIFDKHRGWPKNIGTVKEIITLNPKIIATVRPIAENIVSFLKLMKNDPGNIIDKQLTEKGYQLNTKNRALCLWHNYSSDPFNSLKHGLETNPECIQLVHYKDLILNPQQELKKIYDFLELEPYNHVFKDIKNTCSEKKDDEWGFKDLHNIRGSLSITSNDPLEVLGQELFDYFAEIDTTLITKNQQNEIKLR